MWLKETLPSVQNNVSRKGKKLRALSDWRVPLGHYLATGLFKYTLYTESVNDPNPDSNICIVQSDCLVSNYVMGAWLQFVSLQVQENIFK